MKYKCPACGKIIVNRRVKKCLFCSATLPEDLLFDEKTSARIAKLDAEQSRLHKDRIKPVSGGDGTGLDVSGDLY